MHSFIQAGKRWLRRNLTWSNTQQAWRERLAAGGLLSAAAALIGFADRFSLAQLVVLWGFLLAGLAALMRRGWLTLFGPVLFYDLVRIARRRRYVFIRCLYAVSLTLLLVWVYFIWSLRLPYNEPPKIRDTAQLAETFFFAFMIVQSVLVFVLTPAYTAGAIAEEKDRKTLEFLLATDLRNREIVLGKLASRLGNMTLILLTGLPILSLTQFFGGIDPDLLISAYAGLGLTMLSLAALGVFMSVYARKARDAIVLTYLAAVAYIGLSALCWPLRFIPSVAGFGVSLGSTTITVTDVVDWLNTGNLFVALGRLGAAWGRQPLAELLPDLLRDYAIFHGLVTLICSSGAVLRLRGVALKQTYGKAKRPSLVVRLIGRPPIGSFPMLWKEVLAEPRLRLNWIGRIILGVMVLGSFVPAAWILVDFILEATGLTPRSYLWRWRSPVEIFQQNINMWVRIVGTIVACLTLLGVAVRAATSISGERDRQTFDGLLTTPLSSHAILFAKWLGSIVSVRWGWIWLGAIWAFGVITMGLTPFAVPVLVLAWLVYAAVFAGIGEWCSMSCRTSLRATMWTIVAVIGVSAGHWVLMSMCCYLPLSAGGVSGRNLEGITKVEAGQTPPFVLGWLAMHGSEFSSNGIMHSREAGELTISSLFGLGCWTGFAALLYFAGSVRFRAVTGRGPRLRPDSPWPRPRHPVPRRPELPPLDAIPVFPVVEKDGVARQPDPPRLRGAVEVLDDRSANDPPPTE